MGQVNRSRGARRGAEPGGHWNHHLFRYTDPEGEHFYQIHAYSVDGKVDRWTHEGATVMGDATPGVLVTLARLTAALAKPGDGGLAVTSNPAYITAPEEDRTCPLRKPSAGR